MLPDTRAQFLSFVPPAAIFPLLAILGTLVFTLMAFTAAAQNNQSLTLGWNVSLDPTVVGYVVYSGTVSENYTNRMDVGTNLSVTMTNLQPGMTYYFSITDYNDQYIESPPSSEISCLIPGILLINPAGTNAMKTLSFPVVPSHWYQVQWSTNLQTWTNLWQTSVSTSNAWVQFTDKESGKMGRRYYRLVMH